jgi:hypothetical protein
MQTLSCSVRIPLVYLVLCNTDHNVETASVKSETSYILKNDKKKRN